MKSRQQTRNRIGQIGFASLVVLLLLAVGSRASNPIEGQTGCERTSCAVKAKKVQASPKAKSLSPSKSETTKAPARKAKGPRSIPMLENMTLVI